MLDNLIFGAQAVALATWAFFVVEYQILTRGDWRLTRSGRNIMALGVLVVIALGFLIFANGHSYFRAGQLIVAVFVIAVGVERVRLLFEVQGRQRQREHYKAKQRRRGQE